MTLWVVRIRSFNLHETLAADRLVTASRVVEVRRVSKEANRAFGCILVQVNLERLAVNKWVIGQVDLARGDVGC